MDPRDLEDADVLERRANELTPTSLVWVDKAPSAREHADQPEDKPALDKRRLVKQAEGKSAVIKEVRVPRPGNSRVALGNHALPRCRRSELYFVWSVCLSDNDLETTTRVGSAAACTRQSGANSPSSRQPTGPRSCQTKPGRLMIDPDSLRVRGSSEWYRNQPCFLLCPYLS